MADKENQKPIQTCGHRQIATNHQYFTERNALAEILSLVKRYI